MHRLDGGRTQAAGVAQRAQHGQVEPVDEHQHGVPGVVRRLGLVARSQVARSSACASSRYRRLSRISTSHSTGNSTTTSQAPSVNFTTAKISTTSADTTPPVG